MNGSRALDDAPIRNEQLDLAQQLPARLLSSAAGSAEDAVRSSGLILTKDQLIQLKRYESCGLALPTALNDVIWYLGYEKGAGSGLEAKDFQEVFTHLHDHASRWTPLRTELMNTGSELWVFADQMLVHKDGIEQLYTDIKNQPQEAVAPADLTDFLHYIQQMVELVLQRGVATDALKRRLDEFSLELSRTLMPAVQLKLRLIDTGDTASDVRALNSDLNSRFGRIVEKQRDYQTQVNQAFGASFAKVSLSLYHNTNADKARQELNELRRQQDQILFQLSLKNRVHASLQRVRNDLQELSLILLDADIATQNLVVAWNGLHTYLTQTVIEAEKVDTALSLRRLMNGFRLVAEPWVQIKRDADTLLKVFKEADRDFRRDYGHQ